MQYVLPQDLKTVGARQFCRASHYFKHMSTQIQVRAQAEGWAAGDIRLATALAHFSHQWRVAERLLLSQGEAGPAVEMYRGLGMLKDAVR